MTLPAGGSCPTIAVATAMDAPRLTGREWLLGFVSRCQLLAGGIDDVRAPALLDQVIEAIDAVPEAIRWPELMVAACVIARVNREVSLRADGRVVNVASALVSRCDAGPSARRFLSDLTGGTLPSPSGKDDGRPIDVSRQTDWRIACALQIIEVRYADSALSLRRVAAQLRLSPWHLCRLLRQHTGSTFMARLHDVRIRAAERLLHDSALSIKEIAAAVGYSNTTQLGRHFKHAYGFTPSLARRGVRPLDLL